MTCFVSMPGLMIFKRHLAADGLVLLGDVDDAHAPFADLLHQLVGADDGAQSLRAARRLDRKRRRRCWGREEAARPGIEGEQPLDVATQLGIAADLVQVGRAGLLTLDLEGRQEDLFNIRSRLVLHGSRSGRRSSLPIRQCVKRGRRASWPGRFSAVFFRLLVFPQLVE